MLLCIFMYLCIAVAVPCRCSVIHCVQYCAVTFCYFSLSWHLVISLMIAFACELVPKNDHTCLLFVLNVYLGACLCYSWQLVIVFSGFGPCQFLFDPSWSHFLQIWKSTQVLFLIFKQNFVFINKLTAHLMNNINLFRFRLILQNLIKGNFLTVLADNFAGITLSCLKIETIYLKFQRSFLAACFLLFYFK